MSKIRYFVKYMFWWALMGLCLYFGSVFLPPPSGRSFLGIVFILFGSYCFSRVFDSGLIGNLIKGCDCVCCEKVKCVCNYSDFKCSCAFCKFVRFVE